MVKTTMLLRQRYHFLGLRKAVRKYISQCAKCTQAKSARSSRSLPLTPMFSPAPFLAIAIDIYKPGTTLLNGYKYILTVVDMCTRWVHFIPLKSKYSVEVLLALCHKWFAFHGIPEFILSDRGKEFMGVVSTICQATGIKQIRTTPWHPQSNGLCEVQHATLTRELRIRAQGREVDWDALLPEIQFAFNVTPDDITPGLSPFQLVYGRKPRMSPRDVAFPARIVPPPMPPQHTKYVNTIVKKLQSLHLSALDKQIQRKEDLRRKHDNTRAPLADTLPKRGDVVFVHKPTTTTQKLLMQWSPPCHLVLQAHQNTCLVRPLTSPAGRGGKFPQDVTRNMSSVKVATLRPADFWIGARVLRKHKQAWFLGTVIDILEDEGKTLYQVDYDDCGKEDIDAGALYDSIVYHPRLEQNLFEDTQLPSVGQAIMFAHLLQPRFGVIAEINPEMQKPLAVLLWKPNSKTKSILTARFKSTRMLPSGEEFVRITPAQIKTHVTFLEDGRLEPQSQRKVRSLMTRSQRQPHSAPGSKGTDHPRIVEPTNAFPSLDVRKTTSNQQKSISKRGSKPITKSLPIPRHKHSYNTRSRSSRTSP